MLRKGIAVGLVSVAAVGMSFLLGPLVPVARATNGADTGQASALLLEEIRGLRADVAALRADIKELRVELRGGRPSAKELRIEFTLVPPAGAGPQSRGDIAGRVVGLAELQEHKIVLYARTNLWYVQPLIDSPFTAIASDGTWSNWTHLGGRYAALLVRPSFRPPSVCQSLPSVGGDVVSVAVVTPPTGDILAPTSGEKVSRAFRVQGTLSGIPPGNHVWLAVKIGNLLWPKEPEIASRDGHWTREVVEGGNPPGGRFSLILLAVDPVGNRKIKEWLEHGRKTGDYPGLRSTPGSVQLDRVRDLVLR